MPLSISWLIWIDDWRKTPTLKMGVLSVLNELLHYFICVVNEVILLLKIEPCMIASFGY